MTTPHRFTTRTITVPGLPNVRDLGGLRRPDGARLRRRILVRGPAPSLPTAPAISELGIRAIVDLRLPRERQTLPGPEHTGATVLPRPVSGDMSRIRGNLRPRPSDYLANYRGMLVRAAPVAAEIVELLAEGAATPIYVCCTVGKDRTGVVSALVLRALGVRMADVAGDYALTARAYRALGPDDPRPNWTYVDTLSQLRRRTATPAATMRALITGIEHEHGGVAQLLTRHGLREASRLRCIATVFSSPVRK
ncbi:tyrosine-protein phosphatase [Amycolatopsis rhabdoformis]|uniref:Tyrosine-protein phosphatase n=1 Tax=Amycolatopsis rhabdoformis TaxID=1448059 RepID=A0ABZ1HZ13_9PSEU|nr:tyrosine-protein phosphatase [Amycolatopsis rhabdoformis]WSE27358.1 tyrosine-protein phosphatase [Amycolatopsis rhabdoformis]